jgi:hypothetical protein
VRESKRERERKKERSIEWNRGPRKKGTQLQPSDSHLRKRCWRKDSLFIKWLLRKLDIHMYKIKVDP